MAAKTRCGLVAAAVKESQYQWKANTMAAAKPRRASSCGRCAEDFAEEAADMGDQIRIQRKWGKAKRGLWEGGNGPIIGSEVRNSKFE